MSPIPSNINAPTASHRMRRVGALIDAVCAVVLTMVVVTVIVGLVERARFERSYSVAVAVAIVGALVMLIGLAQQAIAARDLATWRDMAAWQLHASRQRALWRLSAEERAAMDEDTAFDPYMDILSDVLIEDIMSQTQEEGRGA